MNRPRADMSTDSAWDEWGRRDPYYGVLTDPKFRRNAINEQAKREFFESGASHARHVLTAIHHHIDPQFAPRRILDFGCGVGRILVSLALNAEEVVGLDVSPSMLQEARRNCEERKLHNANLLLSDDALSALSGTFDLIHSSIVFQHIPIERGRLIFSNLLRYLSPGGVGAIHFTYSKAHFAATHGLAPRESESRKPPKRSSPDGADPEIQMNPYQMNEILFLMQQQGVQRCYVEFTDHGGELGVFLYFSVAGARTSEFERRVEGTPCPVIRTKRMDLLIGGIPRSGTTALARGVELHPEVFCWSSESALLPMMSELTQGLPMRPENRAGVEQMIGRHLKSALVDQWNWRRKTGGIAPPVEMAPAEIEKLASQVTGVLEQALPGTRALEECASLLRAFLQQYTDRQLIAEKSPSNVLLLPDSLNVARRWLLIHREPFAVIASMFQRSKSDPWADVMSGEIERRIGLYMRHARGIMSAKNHSDEVMVLDLERLTADPAGSLAAVCRFVGVEPTLQYLEGVTSIVGGQTERNTWERFGPLDRWKVLRLCAAEMSALGYSQEYYHAAFDDMTRRVPKRLDPRIEPLHGVFDRIAPGRISWIQRRASLAVYAPGEVGKLVLGVYNQISPLFSALRSRGLDTADLKVSAYGAGPDSRVTLSELSLAKDFSADWSIDLRRAQPVGHHGDWRLFRIDFETSFAYTPCCTLADASDERTFSFGLLDWRLDA